MMGLLFSQSYLILRWSAHLGLNCIFLFICDTFKAYIENYSVIIDYTLALFFVTKYQYRQYHR